MRDLFHGPKLKLKRAEHHINDIVTLHRKYVKRQVQLMRPQRKRKEKKSKNRAIGNRLPTHTPTIIGDAIHNLRVTLDHAYYILVENHGGKPHNYTRFPFGKDRKSLEGLIMGQEPEARPKQVVIEFILDDIQPYEGGNLELYDLHRLDIIDKHATLLPTIRTMNIEKLDYLNELGQPTGGGFTNIVFANPQGQRPGAFIGIDNCGVKLHGNPYETFNILFGPGPFENRNVLSTLSGLRENVSNTLEALQKLI